MRFPLWPPLMHPAQGRHSGNQRRETTKVCTPRYLSSGTLLVDAVAPSGRGASCWTQHTAGCSCAGAFATPVVQITSCLDSADLHDIVETLYTMEQMAARCDALTVSYRLRRQVPSVLIRHQGVVRFRPLAVHRACSQESGLIHTCKFIQFDIYVQAGNCHLTGALSVVNLPWPGAAEETAASTSATGSVHIARCGVSTSHLVPELASGSEETLLSVRTLRHLVQVQCPAVSLYFVATLSQ
jgi:hypothetical protein